MVINNFPKKSNLRLLNFIIIYFLLGIFTLSLISKSGAQIVTEETPFQLPPRPRTPSFVRPPPPETPSVVPQPSPPAAPIPESPVQGEVPAEPPLPAAVAQPTVAPPLPQVVSGQGHNHGKLTLWVDPLMIRVRENEIFQQDIILDNPRGTSIEKIKIVLRYSTTYLEIIDAEPQSTGINIQSLITPEKNPGLQVVLNKVDTEKGNIHFLVKALTANSYVGGRIATITWKSKKRIFYTPVDFAFSTDPKLPGTEIRQMGIDLLGSNLIPTDGVITGGIAILPQ